MVPADISSIFFDEASDLVFVAIGFNQSDVSLLSVWRRDEADEASLKFFDHDSFYNSGGLRECTVDQRDVKRRKGCTSYSELMT